MALKQNPVALMPHQRKHTQTVCDILVQNSFALDTSPMGAGKTHTTFWLAAHFLFKFMVVVCPAAMEAAWRRVGLDYGFGPEQLIRIVSFESLRSTAGNQPKHDMLVRQDTPSPTEPGKSIASFTVTGGFREMVRQGCLVVVDEVHRTKNNSDQYRAVKALTTYIAASRSHSRTLLLSGTPFDKPEQLLRFMRMVGIITEPYLATSEGLTGAGEVVRFCEKLDAKTTAAVQRLGLDVDKMCQELYLQVVQRFVVSSMPPPPLTATHDINNFHAKMSDKDMAALDEGIGMLNRAVHYNEMDDSVVLNKDNMGALTNALLVIELAKAATLLRLALAALLAHPTCKVVIAVNYEDTLTFIKNGFEEAGFGVLKLTGKINKQLREERRLLFQQHDLKHRVLCGNLQVLNAGIDLDDTHGQYPRYAFASPSYIAMYMQQFIGRFLRAKTKSKPHVSYVYGTERKLGSTKKCKQETSIMNALHRKGVVMQLTLPKQVEAGIPFPNTYTKVVEE